MLVNWYHVYDLLTQNAVDRLEALLPTMSVDQKNHWIYSKAFYDKQFFMDFFLPHWQVHRWKRIKPSSIHYDIDESYESGANINLLLPRGHAKTTRILVNTLHDLIYGIRKIRVPYDLMYISSKGLWEISIGKIRVELEINPMLKRVYGSLAPTDEDSKHIIENKNKKWKQSYLELSNGASLETVTKGWSLRGRRKHKVIIDDPEENKDVKNKRIVEEFRDFVFTTVYNMMLPGGNMVVLGTIVGELCLVEHLKHKKWWRTIMRKALEKRQPLRPELWNKKALKERLEIIGTPRFLQEFMHVPISRNDRIIKTHWIRYYQQLPKTFDKIVMGIDVATTEQTRSDYTAVCFLWVKQGTAYVIASYSHKLTPGKNELMLVKLYIQHKPTHVVYESNIEAKLLEDLKNRGLPIKWIKNTKDKHTRLLDGAPEIEFGRVVFSPGCQTLEYQLTHYPDLEHDDVMDAFLIALKASQTKKNTHVVRA